MGQGKSKGGNSCPLDVWSLSGRGKEWQGKGMHSWLSQKSHQHFQPTHKLLPALGAAWQTAGGLCAELHTALGVSQLW